MMCGKRGSNATAAGLLESTAPERDDFGLEAACLPADEAAFLRPMAGDETTFEAASSSSNLAFTSPESLPFFLFDMTLTFFTNPVPMLAFSPQKSTSLASEPWACLLSQALLQSWTVFESSSTILVTIAPYSNAPLSTIHLLVLLTPLVGLRGFTGLKRVAQSRMVSGPSSSRKLLSLSLSPTILSASRHSFPSFSSLLLPLDHTIPSSFYSYHSGSSFSSEVYWYRPSPSRSVMPTNFFLPMRLVILIKHPHWVSTYVHRTIFIMISLFHLLECCLEAPNWSFCGEILLPAECWSLVIFRDNPQKQFH